MLDENTNKKIIIGIRVTKKMANDLKQKAEDSVFEDLSQYLRNQFNKIINGGVGIETINYELRQLNEKLMLYDAIISKMVKPMIKGGIDVDLTEKEFEVVKKYA